MFLEPVDTEKRSCEFHKIRSIFKFRINRCFHADPDPCETVVRLVSDIPVVYRAACINKLAGHEFSVSLQHSFHFIKREFRPLFAFHQFIEFGIFVKIRSLLPVHIHVDVGAHDLGIYRHIELSRDFAELYSLIESVDIRVFIFLAVNDIIQSSVIVPRHTAFRRDAHIHFRRTQIFVDRLQFLRRCRRLLSDCETVPVFKLIERKRTQRERHTERLVTRRPFRIVAGREKQSCKQRECGKNRFLNHFPSFSDRQKNAASYRKP